jgi:hypothetical protein
MPAAHTANPTTERLTATIAEAGTGFFLNLNPHVLQFFAATEFLILHSGQRIILLAKLLDGEIIGR